eukprot:105869_1
MTSHFHTENKNINDTGENIGKIITEIALKQNLTKRHQNKQQAITNYCNNQISGNLKPLQKLHQEDIDIVIKNVCKLENLHVYEYAFVSYINENKINGAKLSEMTKEKFNADIKDQKETTHYEDTKLRIMKLQLNLLEKQIAQSNFSKDAEMTSELLSIKNKIQKLNLNKVETHNEEKEYIQFHKCDNGKYGELNQDVWRYVIKYVSNEYYWKNELKETNKKLKAKLEKSDQYGLFDENIQSLETLDIDRYELPIFREFVQFFFVKSDKEQYNLIADQNSHYLGGEDHSWYNAFIESWRSVPSWYTYDHDVLLLELVLRHGLDCNKILQDLDDRENATQYEIRLNCKKRKTQNDPYYEFRRYCSIRYNLYHRLKYVTNVLVKNLQNSEYGGNVPLVNIRIPNEKDRPTYNLSGLLFCDYQREVHREYVQHEVPPLHFDQQVKKVISERSVPIHKTTRTNKCCGGCCSQRRSERYCCFFKKDKRYCCFCKKEKPPTFERPPSKYQRLDFNEIDDEDFDYLRNKLEIEFEGQDENISTAITKIDSMDGIMNWSSPQLRSTGRLSNSYISQRRRTLHQISLPSVKMDPKKYTHPSMLALGGIISENDTDESGETKRYRYTDPFTERDMNNELLHALQTFNLMIYGSSLVECIIRQLEKQKRPAYWHILGEVLNALPYPLAISAVNNPAIKDVLRHAATPATLNTICLRLVQGSSFQTSACLGIAEFFEDISKKDMVQEDIWKNYSEEFEKLAYEQMSHIESNHLLFVLLTVPMAAHEDKSLVNVAL